MGINRNEPGVDDVGEGVDGEGVEGATFLALHPLQGMSASWLRQRSPASLRASVNAEALQLGVADELAGACAHHGVESRRSVSQDATRRELRADDHGGREATEGVSTWTELQTDGLESQSRRRQVHSSAR